jgi:hypothetical protein
MEIRQLRQLTLVQPPHGNQHGHEHDKKDNNAEHHQYPTQVSHAVFFQNYKAAIL